MKPEFHGSTVALAVGALGVVAGLSAAGRGEPAIDSLNLGMITTLSALAYRSAKRRALGIVTASALRVFLEILAMFIVIFLTLGMDEEKLKGAMMTNPLVYVVAPLWGLIAYSCVAFRGPPRRASVDQMSAPSQPVLSIERAIYERVDRELQNGPMDRALWTRVFAEADGNDGRARARYIRARSEQLAQDARDSLARSDLSVPPTLPAAPGNPARSGGAETIRGQWKSR